MTFNDGARQREAPPTPLPKQPDEAFRPILGSSVDRTLLKGPEAEVEKIQIQLVIVG